MAAAATITIIGRNSKTEPNNSPPPLDIFDELIAFPVSLSIIPPNVIVIPKTIIPVIIDEILGRLNPED